MLEGLAGVGIGATVCLLTILLLSMAVLFLAMLFFTELSLILLFLADLYLVELSLVELVFQPVGRISLDTVMKIVLVPVLEPDMVLVLVLAMEPVQMA